MNQVRNFHGCFTDTKNLTKVVTKYLTKYETSKTVFKQHTVKEAYEFRSADLASP